MLYLPTDVLLASAGQKKKKEKKKLSVIGCFRIKTVGYFMICQRSIQAVCDPGRWEISPWQPEHSKSDPGVTTLPHPYQGRE